MTKLLSVRAWKCTLAGGAALAVVAVATPAAAVDCAKDFTGLMTTRQSIITRINSFNKKRPTPAMACAELTKLVNSDKKSMEWMTTNKDWCQIPDELFNNLKSQSEQSVAVRAKACSAAAQQAKQLQQLKAQQREAGGPTGLPGSGVRLPQGAL